MSAKHTPGPWSIHQHMGGMHVTDCMPAFMAHTAYIGAGDMLIAECEAYAHAPGKEYSGWPRVTDFDVNAANARLIAEAPTLLAECDAAVRAASEACAQLIAMAEWNDTTHAVRDAREAVQCLRRSQERLNAAIAKATGEAA